MLVQMLSKCFKCHGDCATRRRHLDNMGHVTKRILESKLSEVRSTRRRMGRRPPNNRSGDINSTPSTTTVPTTTKRLRRLFSTRSASCLSHRNLVVRCAGLSRKLSVNAIPLARRRHHRPRRPLNQMSSGATTISLSTAKRPIRSQARDTLS